MKIFKAFAAILLLATSLFALSKEQIKPEIEAKTTKVIEILKNTNLDNNAKTKEIFALARKTLWVPAKGASENFILNLLYPFKTS